MKMQSRNTKGASGSILRKALSVKMIVITASTLYSVAAQNHIMLEFFPCGKEQPCGGGAECCEFQGPFATQENPHFCMTDA